MSKFMLYGVIANRIYALEKQLEGFKRSPLYEDDLINYGKIQGHINGLKEAYDLLIKNFMNTP